MFPLSRLKQIPRLTRRGPARFAGKGKGHVVLGARTWAGPRAPGGPVAFPACPAFPAEWITDASEGLPFDLERSFFTRGAGGATEEQAPDDNGNPQRAGYPDKARPVCGL